MSILIPSNEPGVFAEPEIPMAYNPDTNAWEDTEGYVYDSATDAWEEAWPRKLWLYKDGDECADVTGGWNAYPYRNRGYNKGKTPELNKNINSMTVSLNNILSSVDTDALRGCIFIENKIDLSGYKTLNIHFIKAHAVGTRPGTIWEEKNCYDAIEIGITDLKNDGYVKQLPGLIVKNEDKEDFVTTLDLADVLGSYYVVVQLLLITLNSNNAYATIDKIWLEK